MIITCMYNFVNILIILNHPSALQSQQQSSEDRAKSIFSPVTLAKLLLAVPLELKTTYAAKKSI